MRSRAKGSRGLLGAVFERGIFEPVHFVMERKLMEEIRERAGDHPLSARADDVQVVLWVLTFATFLTSAVLVVAGRRPEERMVTFVGPGLPFQFLTLVQPKPIVGAALVVLLTVIGPASRWSPVPEIATTNVARR